MPEIPRKDVRGEGDHRRVRHPRSSGSVITKAATLLLFLGLVAGCAAEPDGVPAGGEGDRGDGDTPLESGSVTDTDYLDLSPEAFAQRIAEVDGLVLVNVHLPYEGEIPGTDLHLPFNDLEPHLSELPQDRNAPVAVYCMGDGMSLIAADALAERGYANVVRLAGGMTAWHHSGRRLEGFTPGEDEGAGSP